MEGIQQYQPMKGSPSVPVGSALSPIRRPEGALGSAMLDLPSGEGLLQLGLRL